MSTRPGGDVSVRGIQAMRPFYSLEIRLSPTIAGDLKEEYRNAIASHNKKALSVVTGDGYTFDAGFDLRCPHGTTIPTGGLGRIDYGLQCRMRYITGGTTVLISSTNAITTTAPTEHQCDHCATTTTTTTTTTAPGLPVPMSNHNCYVGYYLYPRSSTCVKTPLRLANSVGIIDSGYRGNIIAVFDNISSNKSYATLKNQRLVQLCPPNLTHPLIVSLVDSLDDTMRGAGGFGSTGV